MNEREEIAPPPRGFHSQFHLDHGKLDTDLYEFEE